MSEARAPRFPLFDSLRAIAALSVLALHLPFVPEMTGAARKYFVELGAGVTIFFLISGFLLYRPFVQARYAGEQRPSALHYAQRRFLRLVPAYWLALPFVVLLVGSSGEAPTATDVFTPHGIVSYFGFLQVYDSQTLLGGISAAWTLCVEVAFYAMLPAWAYLMSRLPSGSDRSVLHTELLGLALLFAIGAAWTSIAAITTHVTPRVFVDVTQLRPWLYVLPAYLDQFALGMALAVVSVAVARRSREPAAVGLLDRLSWVPWVAAAVLFFMLAHVDDWFHSWAGEWIVRHEIQGAFALALLLPAVFGSTDRGVVRRVLANRALLWVGLVSYGVYLWHVAIMRQLEDWGARDSLGNLPFTVLALAGTLLVAAASFYGLERRALRLGRRLSNRTRSEDADVRMRDLEARVP